MTKNSIATMIRYYRKQSGLSQKALADLAGVGKTAVFDIENSKSNMRFDTLKKLCEVLNINIEFHPPFAMNEEDES
jgi:HTH-type transcriptional regulator / antitoxin HipB